MPRIHTDTAMLWAQHDLGRTNRAMQQAVERLTSGLRINRASDDPGGLISSELLASQADALVPAIDQAQRAGNLVATADGALAQIAELLLSIQQLVTEAANTAGLNDAEVAANQLQIDAAVESIRRLAETTTFAGRGLLDGSLNYTTSSVAASAVRSPNIARAAVGTADVLPVRVDVTVSAQPGILQFRNSQLTAAAHVRVAGRDGSETFSFTSGTAASAILMAVNQAADDTGVSATLINSGNPASGIQLTSADLGSRSFVSVEALTGAMPTSDVNGDPTARDHGRDAAATINGAAANADGQHLSLFSTDLELTLRLADGFAIGSTAFAITGGGALFAVGPSVASGLASVGVPSADPSNLGDDVVGFLSDVATGGPRSLRAGGAAAAAGIVETAIGQVSSLRGRLGSFAQHTLERGLDSMTDMLENVRAGESAIRDADFAIETSALTRAQLLQQVTTAVMAMLNSSRESILRLLS